MSKARSKIKKRGGKMHQFIMVDPDLCTGCETCESVCSFVHEGVFNPINARIHRVRVEPVFNIALACQKCEDAPCVRSCPEKALERDEETGSIIVDDDKCNGCGFCIRACDFGVISLNINSQKALVCDLCENMKEEFIDPEVGEPEPQCILVCPKEAISLKNVEQIGEETRLDAVKRLFGEQLEEYES
ncbi:MAG: 4Fe-4S ferredoxin [Promethearchaeota archaeon]|jgi:Fe-S-cluster-containing hydrogenase component 2|nr:MAG: 4Fe-4S ferredoxin [Candidatus Lokiarchaeota archaeon]